MKKLLSIILSAIMLLSLTSCTKANKVNAEWQEKYDAGLRYLNNLEYESAIQSFNEAIQIDPKQAPAYVGLADVYIAQGDYDKASNTIDSAISEIGDNDLLVDKKEEIDNKNQTDNVKEETIILDEGGYVIHQYDNEGHIISISCYNSDGSYNYGINFENCGYFTPEYDSAGNIIKSTQYREDGTINYIDEYNPGDMYDSPIKKTFFSSDGDILRWNILEYDENGKMVKSTTYDYNGTITDWFVFEYDENGKRIGRVDYNADGTISATYEF